MCMKEFYFSSLHDPLGKLKDRVLDYLGGKCFKCLGNYLPFLRLRPIFR